MNSFRRAIGALAVSGTALATLATGALPASAASVKIQGNLGAAGAGYKVLLVGQRGKATVATADASGTFAITTSKSDSKGASLQLVTPANRYAGPVVIAKEKVAGSWCSKTKLAGSSVNLGSMTMSSKGFAIPKKAPKASTYARLSVLARTSAGNPLSAGTGGIVKISAAQKKKCSKSKVGSASVSASDEASNLLGADMDGDGLPNALDADDDGDLQIDAVDPTTTESAAMNPWVSLRSNNPLYNASINQGLTAADIAAALGNGSSYAIQFFIGQRNLLGNNPNPNGVQYAWVDCGELIYCGGAAPTARTLSTHTSMDNTGVPWKTYSGGFTIETKSQPATVNFTVTGVNPDASVGNALFLSHRNTSDAENVYWRATLFPNQGADTVNTVKPGDVYTVRFKTAAGADQSVVMMLNPHAVTVPGLTKVNGAAYAGATISPDSSGKIAFEFFRPQRLTTTGEEGTFRDMGSLRYGMIYSGQMDTPCEGGAYSGYGSDFTLSNANPNDMASRLWPLNDKTTADIATSPTADQIAFTLDVRACVGAAVYDAAARGAKWNFELVAAGQNLTGGSNRAALGLSITKP
ncbi:MAG: hypothetical protein ACKOCC_02540 [Actinomycetota bacterium]